LYPGRGRGLMVAQNIKVLTREQQRHRCPLHRCLSILAGLGLLMRHLGLPGEATFLRVTDPRSGKGFKSTLLFCFSLSTDLR